MEEKELKCKLEELALGMGYEVKEKLKKEIDPIYSVLKTLIILVFVTIISMIASFTIIEYDKNNLYNTCVNQKEKIVYVKEDITKRMHLVKTKVKNNNLYKYYRIKNNNIWEYYTISIPLKEVKGEY